MNFDVIKQNIGDYPLSKTLLFDETDSTNDRLKTQPVGTLAVAKKQLNGKGTRGRSFESEEGGLYFSFVSPVWDEPGLMTPAAAVAVSETLDALTGLETCIKWVNDVYVGGKKICGILCERTKFGVVVGIGINLENDLSDNLSAFAASVKSAGGTLPQKEKIIAGIVSRFSAFEKDEKRLFMDEYKRKNLLIGKQVEYVLNGKTSCGAATDVTSDGRLVVDGKIYLSSGDVRLKSKILQGENI